MPDILHRVGVKASPEATFDALTTREGLAAWWTGETTGDFNVGGVIEFRFGTLGYFNMKVLELDRGKRVRWSVVDGPSDWIGTTVSFDLAPEDQFTKVLFKHQGWKEPVEFMHHCSTKWAVYLLSMKSLVENGTGAPFPNDTRISNNGD
jgi:uncharacterized protein YndB with AHSA1/START domain